LHCSSAHTPTKTQNGLRLIEQKKQLARAMGGVTGAFGLASLPADLVGLAWLQLALTVEIAALYRINLKADSARQELIELFWHLSGMGPVQRAAPRVLGRIAGALFEKGGLKLMGRAVPLVSSPLSAYLNNQHIQSAGEEALRYYGGFSKLKRAT
jgi:hypothetical protein